jgi:outer membrane protein
MNRCRFVTFAWIVATVPIPGLAQTALTVDAAIRQVLAQHPSITRSESAVRSAEARQGQTESALLPDVGIVAEYSRVAPVPSLNFPGLGEFNLFPTNNYDAHVRGTYTVLDFGKARSAVDLAATGVQTARDQVRLSKTDLAFETIGSFHGILLLRRSVHVADTTLAVLRDHLVVVRAKVETGSSTALDSLNVVVRVANASLARTELINRLEKEEEHLRQLMGLPDSTRLVLEGDFAVGGVLTNVDSLLQLANAQRPELKLARDAVKTAETQKTVAWSGNLPSLHVAALVGAKNGYIPNLNTIKANWVGAVGLSVPVFDGYRTARAVDEAEAGIHASKAREEEVTRRVRMDVVNSISDLHAAWTRVQISETQVQEAVAALRIARTKYENGTATNVDVLDAQNAASSAALLRVQALYSYVLSRYALERTVGGQLYTE